MVDVQNGAVAAAAVEVLVVVVVVVAVEGGGGEGGGFHSPRLYLLHLAQLCTDRAAARDKTDPIMGWRKYLFFLSSP